jgi:hypothetical protein
LTLIDELEVISNRAQTGTHLTSMQINKHRGLNMHNEQGGARLKFLIFIVVFALILYVGYMYVPVAIDAYYFKDVMQNKVDQAMAQGYDGNWLKDQLAKSGPDYHVPAEAIITPSAKEGRMSVRVQFTRPIAFPGYTYNYEFDHTVQSGAFLNVK